MSNVELLMGQMIISEDIKTGCLNIKIKFVPFIYHPWEKGILEYITSARIFYDISCIPSVI